MNNLVKILLFSTTVLVMCNNASKCMNYFSENAYSNTEYKSSKNDSIPSEINPNNQQFLFAQNGNSIQQFEDPNNNVDPNNKVNKIEFDLEYASEKYSELKSQYSELDKRFQTKINILQWFIQKYNKLLKEEKKYRQKNNTNSNTVENKIQHIVIDKKTAELLGYKENETITPFNIIKVTKEQIIQLNKNVNSDNFEEISKQSSDLSNNLINVISTLADSITTLSPGKIPDNLYKNTLQSQLQDIKKHCNSIDYIVSTEKDKDGARRRYLNCYSSLIDEIEILEDVINIIYNNELIFCYKTEDNMLSLKHYIQPRLNDLIELHTSFKEQKIDNDNYETVQENIQFHKNQYILHKHSFDNIFKVNPRFVIVSNNVEKVTQLLNTLKTHLGIKKELTYYIIKPILNYM